MRPGGWSSPDGLSALTRRGGLSPPCEDTPRRWLSATLEEVLPQNPTMHPALGLGVFRTVRNKLLVFKPPVYGIL